MPEGESAVAATGTVRMAPAEAAAPLPRWSAAAAPQQHRSLSQEGKRIHYIASQLSTRIRV